LTTDAKAAAAPKASSDRAIFQRRGLLVIASKEKALRFSSFDRISRGFVRQAKSDQLANRASDREKQAPRNARATKKIFGDRGNPDVIVKKEENFGCKIDRHLSLIRSLSRALVRHDKPHQLWPRRATRTGLFGFFDCTYLATPHISPRFPSLEKPEAHQQKQTAARSRCRVFDSMSNTSTT